MGLKKVLTDRVSAQRPTRVEDAHGSHQTMAPLGWGPLPALLQLTSTYENVTIGASAGDVAVGYRTCTILGWPDLKPDDELIDQNDRVFPIEGDLDFRRAGRLKVTIAKLRTAEVL